MRANSMQFFFQMDHATIERSDVYSNAGPVMIFGDTDHYLIGVQNAWDIARRMRGNLNDILFRHFC